MPAKNADPILQGAQALERGDLAQTERIANSVLERHADPDAMHLLGLARLRQNRMEEAHALLRQSLSARPGQPRVLLNLGKLLALMKRDPEAAKALEDAVLWSPGLAEAWYELGELRHRAGDYDGAEEALRKVLFLEPHYPLVKLSLGLVLKDAGRPGEAELVLAQGLGEAGDDRMKAAFAYNLALAQYDQGRKDAALANFNLVSRLDPGRGSADLARADLLQEMLRYDEALTLLEELIRREPLNDDAHAAYNDLLHRLGRDGDFLKSYDRVPRQTPLEMGKAGFLLKTGRAQEAQALYADIAGREPGHAGAALGQATALNRLGRHGEAMAALEQVYKRDPENIALLHHLAETALQQRDPQKAAAMAETALVRAPLDQYGLALLGSAWRMMGDERDESLNGYDALIRVFDLEPPPGFSSMAAFNAELGHWLDRQHPATRAPLNQTLRGGSQTRGHIFGAGHALAENLKSRISETLRRYIGEAGSDPRHPFRSRRGAGFRFTGSWSSRLADCGFHVNHVHPEGWISSCYYVAVPEAARNETSKEGWIKFGEPAFEAGLGIRRAIQPVPGRLVLFPSYMWHGTIAFHDASPRTTIAFDAVPLA